MSMPDRIQADEVRMEAREISRPEPIDVSSTFAKLWQGAKRTWGLYKRSKMGLLGLGIVLAFVIMAVFAPLISPYTPDFRAPSIDIFIADNANVDMVDHKNWSAPMGLPTAAIGNALKRIMVYSPDGSAVVFPITQGLSPVTGESGIIVQDPTTYTNLPKNLTYLQYVQFGTNFTGSMDVRGTFFFMLEGKVLHLFESNFVDSTYSWTLPFAPIYHSNLWNGYIAQGSGTGRLALAFANETSVWLIDMRSIVTSSGINLADVSVWTSSVTIPAVKIISSPIVMDTNIKNGSALVVPTDKGLYAYSLNVTTVTPPLFNVTYATHVEIGPLLWAKDYQVSPGDVVTPIPTEFALTFPNPADSTGLFGKTNFVLATDDGRLISYDTFNGTIIFANRVVMGTITAYTLTGVFPSTAGIAVVGEAGSTRGFIAIVDPNFGAVLNNHTAYSQTEGFITATPNFVPALKNFIYSTDRGIIYLANELMSVYATFTVPSGGAQTPVMYEGNIYIADSTTGNYFGTITKENSLYVETLSGVNVAPLPPGTYPSGNRYILGTDYEGHDILSWLIYGTRSELLVGVTAALFAVVIGTVVGLVAGYYSGLVDDLLMRATDVVLSLPFIVIALLFASVFGPLLINIIIIIAVLSWAGIARVIRSVTLSLKERSFVDAAIIAGASESRLIFRHIAPNVLPYTFLYMTFTVSGAIITEAILAFLGYGDPSNVTWGMMLQFLQISGHSLDAPWWLLPPGIAITLLSLSFYLIGRAFDEVVNPRLRRR